jgi:hypothetical protein
MKMTFLLEVEHTDHTNLMCSKVQLRKQLEAITSALLKGWTVGMDPKVTVTALTDDAVIVDADALLRLQKRAGLKE